MARILVGMSGGLDSASVAARLVAEGHEVIGASLRLVDEEGDGPRTCCSAEDLSAAKRSCERLGIPHYVFDQRTRFGQEIIGPFVESYLHGLTPNPCIFCNQFFKFGELYHRAQAMSAKLATGHYVRRVEHDGQVFLARAVDRHKDQSYFLYRISPQALAGSVFPLGDFHKREVRDWALVHNLVPRDKLESQEICFAPDGAASFVEQAVPSRLRPGQLVDQSGKALAQHPGVHRFTIGQRRGLGLGGGGKNYVVAIDGPRAQVKIGSGEALLHDRIRVNSLRLFVEQSALEDQPKITVQIRARHSGALARLHWIDDDSLEIKFDVPQSAPAPGQSAVFYLDDKLVLGGGIIY